VAGDEGGWQHLVIDVGPHVRGKQAVELIFRLQVDKDITDPPKQIVECFCYIDDVHLFGGTVKSGDFESDEGWIFECLPPSNMYSRLWSGEARSGKYCCVLGIGYSGKVKAGCYSQVKQSVPIRNP